MCSYDENLEKLIVERNAFEKRALIAEDRVKNLIKYGNLMKVNLGYSQDPFAPAYIELWNKAKELN